MEYGMGYSSKLENQCILRPVSKKKNFFTVSPEFPKVITRYPLFPKISLVSLALLPQVILTSFIAEKAERTGLFGLPRVSPLPY